MLRTKSILIIIIIIIIFFFFFLHSWVSNSKVNNPILPEFVLVRDFMPVQVICSFHTELIKTKRAMLRTRFNMGVFGTKGQVTPKSVVRSGRNSNSFQMLCMSRLSASFIKFRLKLSRLCSGQGLICLFVCFFCAKGEVSPIWPEFELIRVYMPVQIICKSHKDSIKTKKAMLRTRSIMVFFGRQWQVTRKPIVRSGRNSYLSEIL